MATSPWESFSGGAGRVAADLSEVQERRVEHSKASPGWTSKVDFFRARNGSLKPGRPAKLELGGSSNGCTQF